MKTRQGWHLGGEHRVTLPAGTLSGTVTLCQPCLDHALVNVIPVVTTSRPILVLRRGICSLRLSGGHEVAEALGGLVEVVVWLQPSSRRTAALELDVPPGPRSLRVLLTARLEPVHVSEQGRVHAPSVRRTD